MADASTQAQTYTNAGVANATSYLPANNYKNVINQADVGRELIVKISADAGMLDIELGAAIAYINTSHGSAGSGDSAFTVAAVGTADGSAFVSGTTDVIFLRCQGTGDLTVGTADQAIAGLTVTIEAIFTAAK